MDDEPAYEVDPALLARPDVRGFLAAHDLGAFYRVLCQNGCSQHQIAKATRTQQSQVAEIIKGRQVIDHRVLARIATGLGIPRERMGLSWWGPDGSWHGPDDAYPGQVTVATTTKGVSAEMLRRHLIALGGVAMVGAPVAKLGALLAGLPGPPPLPLPSRLGPIHVAQVRDLTRRLGQVGNSIICAAEVLGAAVTWATRLLAVPGAEPVQRALKTAVAELHIEAGWAGFDAGHYSRTLHHYAHALELAIEVEDAYLQALALGYAGLASVVHGHPNDGLKLLQLGQVKAWDIAPDDQRAVVVGENGPAAVEANTLAESATAHAHLGHLTAADTDLATARALWRPTRSDPYGDLDRPAAKLALRHGRLDLAETLTAASVRRWEGGSQISRTQSDIILATIHITAGESGGLQLAHGVITDVSKLSSVRLRAQLLPLAGALGTRRGSDYTELARQARQVAATRA